ncbi:Transposase [Anaerovirgula multivorans]|uniref:Transposase n=1 Tax=Anaerovirgula multivorans TaxID=312168 RepID=A0A239HK65_9FIRM|nr:Transposase [Anaerovirgula multivorans]
MNINYSIIQNLIGFQGIAIIYFHVKTLDNGMEYILHYYDYPISNGTTERNNHKVKNIKRRAYGYRNSRNWEVRVKYKFLCS